MVQDPQRYYSPSIVKIVNSAIYDVLPEQFNAAII